MCGRLSPRLDYAPVVQSIRSSASVMLLFASSWLNSAVQKP
jgi:hypothetical protein